MSLWYSQCPTPKISFSSSQHWNDGCGAIVSVCDLIDIYSVGAEWRCLGQCLTAALSDWGTAKVKTGFSFISSSSCLCSGLLWTHQVPIDGKIASDLSSSTVLLSNQTSACLGQNHTTITEIFWAIKRSVCALSHKLEAWAVHKYMGSFWNS